MTAKAFVVLILVACAACAYDAHFEDCTVRCTTDVGCPDGLTCKTEGFCRVPGETKLCAAVLETSPSCTELAETCGPNNDEDCCSSVIPIPGGTFFRSHDVAGDGMYPSTNYPATVSPFVLDRFEVTVGRFRKFVEAGQGTRLLPPVERAGEHAEIVGSGWDASWDAELAPDTTALTAALKCNSTYQTWTDLPVANENLPINCITWYEAMAFCIWNNSHLPTEAEWDFAAAGGDEQRAYSWSNPPGSTEIDCSYANYNSSGTPCVNGTTDSVNRVGSASPKGDSKWGQADLAGNVWEWILDWHASPYPTTTCNNCVNLSTASGRVVRGGSFVETAQGLRVAGRDFIASSGNPASRFYTVGARCSRTP